MRAIGTGIPKLCIPELWQQFGLEPLSDDVVNLDIMWLHHLVTAILALSTAIINQISLVISQGSIVIWAIPNLVPPFFFQGKGLPSLQLLPTTCSLPSLTFCPSCILPYGVTSSPRTRALWHAMTVGLLKTSELQHNHLRSHSQPCPNGMKL